MEQIPVCRLDGERGQLPVLPVLPLRRAAASLIVPIQTANGDFLVFVLPATDVLLSFFDVRPAAINKSAGTTPAKSVFFAISSLTAESRLRRLLLESAASGVENHPDCSRFV